MTQNKLSPAVLLIALGLSACSSDMDELQQQVESIKKNQTEHVEPLPQIKPYETYAYNVGTLRSPFVASAPVRNDVAGAVRPDAKRAREFLEQFPIDSMKMVGTLALQGKNYGLVQGRDGLVHRVLPGSYMGQNDGRVTSITSNKISIIEIVPDGVGGYIERPAALTLTE
ncbi:MAG TPA: pilus assembly protein PilP [Povalibacter sp.]|nr:pilus assembly protein PilP [Povalibacter sp.]